MTCFLSSWISFLEWLQQGSPVEFNVTHVITSAKFATKVPGYTCVNGVPLGGLPSSGFWDQAKNILLTVLDIDDKVIKWKNYHVWVSRIQNVKQAFMNLAYNSRKCF